MALEGLTGTLLDIITLVLLSWNRWANVPLLGRRSASYWLCFDLQKQRQSELRGCLSKIQGVVLGTSTRSILLGIPKLHSQNIPHCSPRVPLGV